MINIVQNPNFLRARASSGRQGWGGIYPRGGQRGQGFRAGNDIRTALLCFALDASHGYERTHMRSLDCVARLLAEYMLSDPIFPEGANVIGEMDTFPMIATPTVEQQKSKKRKG